MAFPPVTQWTVDANSMEGFLTINVDSSTGVVTGDMFDIDASSHAPITGFWNDDARMLTFIRVIDSSHPTNNQFFTGYLFDNSLTHPTQKLVHQLTGYFESFAGSGATSQRIVYGWLARGDQNL